MTTFKDIIGYEKEKEELMYICDMIINSEKYKEKGVYIPRALLLYGEPGTGKTTMSKALINESGRKCFYCKKNKSNGDFVDEIRNVFEEAKKNAPSIILLDDMDKFAEDNLEFNQNKEEFAAIQTCMEDLEDSDVFVLATANFIKYLPDSLLRTGRFGRKIEIGKPNQETIKKIIEHHINTNNIKCCIDAESLSNILDGNSCATIKEIINEAQIYSIYNNNDSISKEELTKAILKNLFNEIEKDQNENNVLYRAIHEAGHAVVGLVCGRKVSLVTLATHGTDGGSTFLQEPKSNGNDLKIFNDEVSIAMGGKAATELYNLGTIDFGAENDIDKAIKLISESMEYRLSHGFNYGYYVSKYDERQSNFRLDMVVDKAYEVLEGSYNKAKMIIQENRQLVDEISSELIKNGTLLYDDINDIYSKYQGVKA